MNKSIRNLVKKTDYGFSLMTRTYLYAENIREALFGNPGVNDPIFTVFSEVWRFHSCSRTGVTF
jgi:hypothetical protein